MNDISIKSMTHINNEKIQISLRVFLVLSIIGILGYIDSNLLEININAYMTLLDFFITIIFMNIIYSIFLIKYSYSYQKIRIMVISVLDILSSVYIMHLVGEISIYFTVLLLWYILGYSLRYGKDVGYLVYIIVLVSWVILITNSDFWIENSAFAYSWLITYGVLPLYYFQLVKSMQKNLVELEKEVEVNIFKASHDILTSLPNRESFDKKLLSATKNFEKFALLFIDMDGFKLINDEYGHHVGDEILIEFSRRLDVLNNYTARLSGDEFVTIVEYEDEEKLRAHLEYMISQLNIKSSNYDINFSSSIGVILFPFDAQEPYDLKRRSDKAMYEAKRKGKNTFVFYKDLNL